MDVKKEEGNAFAVPDFYRNSNFAHLPIGHDPALEDLKLDASSSAYP